MAADQISKLAATSFFLITCNRGVAFGIDLPGPFDILLPLIFLIIIFYFLARETRMVNLVSVSMIFGGGLSNLADRVTSGCVRDFIVLGQFSSFNLADAAITFGVAIFLFNIWGSTPNRGQIPKRPKGDL